MIYLKKYIGITVLMLCFVFYSTSTMGGDLSIFGLFANWGKGATIKTSDSGSTKSFNRFLTFGTGVKDVTVPPTSSSFHWKEFGLGATLVVAGVLLYKWWDLSTSKSAPSRNVETCDMNRSTTVNETLNRSTTVNETLSMSRTMGDAPTKTMVSVGNQIEVVPYDYHCVLCMKGLEKKSMCCETCCKMCSEFDDQIKMEYSSKVDLLPLVPKVEILRYVAVWVPGIGAKSGIESIVEHFVKGKNPLTDDAFLEFIYNNLLTRSSPEEQSAIAQMIIIGHHLMAAKEGKTTSKVARVPKNFQSEASYSRLASSTNWSFLQRIRLMSGFKNTVDPKIWTTWETGCIPKDGYEKTLDNIMLESALGWPVFTTLEQASFYKKLMPSTHRIMSIYKEGFSEKPVGYMVGVHPDGSGIVFNL